MARVIRWLAVLAVLLLPELALANELVRTVAVVAVAFFAPAALPYVLAANAAYSYFDAKDKARKARHAAQDAYNASLQDRTTTLATADAPWQVVYGTATVGGKIVAELTAGDRDQFKYLVIVWAAHECDGVVQVLIGGEPVTLDAQGRVTTAKWVKEDTSDQKALSGLSISNTGTIDLTSLANAGNELLGISITRAGVLNNWHVPSTRYTLTNGVVQLDAGLTAAAANGTATAYYLTRTRSYRIRIVHHLGTADQAADAMLLADCPGQWTANDRLAGLTYSAVRLELDEPELQSGPPDIRLRLRGAKVYDVRTGVRAWSDNPALCTRDFLLAEYGKAQTWQQVDDDYTLMAANVSDEGVFDSSGNAVHRYTCNGACTTDADPDDTLRALVKCMAGDVYYAQGVWRMEAGAYTAAVMVLSDADNAGPVQMVAAPATLEAFSGVRGQFFDPAKHGQRTDYPPYKNTALATEDGGETWGALNLPFTDSAWRAHNLARIHVETARGMRLTYPAKWRAARLRVGQRVVLHVTPLQINGWVFRVVGKRLQLGQPVMLSLQQDGPGNYDLIDAPASPSWPVSNQPDPWQADAPTGFTAHSDSTTLVRNAEGLIVSRLLLLWDGMPLGYTVHLQYRLDGSNDWVDLPAIPATESAQSLLVPGPLGGLLYVLRIQARNPLRVPSEWRYALCNIDDTASVLTGVGTGRTLRLATTAQLVRLDAAGTPTPATISLSAVGEGLTGAPVFAGSLPLTVAGNVATLNTADMDADSEVVTVTWDGLTDQVTLLRVRDGADGAVSGGNLIQNSDLSDGDGGWIINWLQDSGPVSAFGLASQFVGVPWQIPGLEAWGVSRSNTTTSGYTEYTPAASSLPVTPGDTMELSAYVWCHRCTTNLAVSFYDAAGQWMAAAGVGGTSGPVEGGTSLAQWMRLGGWVTVPAGAVSCRPIFSVPHPGTSEADWFSVATRVYFSQAPAGKSVLSPWAPSGRRGAAALSGLLTNESHSVATLADGSGGNYATAGGRFMVYAGSADVTAQCTFAIASNVGVDGLAISSDGFYTVTGASADVGTATLRATYQGTALDKVYSISRSKAGPQGLQGAQGIQGLQGLQGPQGTQGIQGPIGATGQTTYFHIAYAASADGTVGFTQTGSGDYIGTYTDFNPTDSSNPAAYAWRLVRGAQGAQGLQGIAGTNGANGQTSYLHIKYSNDGGATFTANSGEDAGAWIGQRVDFTLADSSNPADYTWSRTTAPTYRQEADPATSATVPEGAVWLVPSTGKSYVRQGGGWFAHVGTGSVDTPQLASGSVTGLGVMSVGGPVQIQGYISGIEGTYRPEWQQELARLTIDTDTTSDDLTVFSVYIGFTGITNYVGDFCRITLQALPTGGFTYNDIRWQDAWNPLGPGNPRLSGEFRHEFGDQNIPPAEVTREYHASFAAEYLFGGGMPRTFAVYGDQSRSGGAESLRPVFVKNLSIVVKAVKR